MKVVVVEGVIHTNIDITPNINHPQREISFTLSHYIARITRVAVNQDLNPTLKPILITLIFRNCNIYTVK